MTEFYWEEEVSFWWKILERLRVFSIKYCAKKADLLNIKKKCYEINMKIKKKHSVMFFLILQIELTKKCIEKMIQNKLFQNCYFCQEIFFVFHWIIKENNFYFHHINQRSKEYKYINHEIHFVFLSSKVFITM